MEETKNPAHVLADKLRENKKSLHIARVPEKTKEDFITLADEEFCSDYGMLLKFLMDDMVKRDERIIFSVLDEHEKRILDLESNLKEQAPSAPNEGRKMLNGDTRSIRRDTQNE